MRKTRPGIDRATKQDLYSRKRGYLLFLADHERNCYQCSTAQADALSKCDSWWREARALHKVNRKLRAFERPLEADQPTLPGMP